jgi:hypothetical protein
MPPRNNPIAGSRGDCLLLIIKRSAPDRSCSPETVFVFPLAADINRFPPEGKARVWRSDDVGETWTPSESGLPDRFFAAVLRDAMTADNADQPGLYFGSRDGLVFVSTDDGANWRQIAAHLPDVLSVRAAVV